MKIPVITKKKKRVNLDYGDFALTVNCSGARTSAWHDKLTQCWLMLIRMSGWSASAETPHLILGSGKRPDIRAKIGDKEVLFGVRTNTATTAGSDVNPSHFPGPTNFDNGVPYMHL